MAAHLFPQWPMPPPIPSFRHHRRPFPAHLRALALSSSIFCHFVSISADICLSPSPSSDDNPSSPSSAGSARLGGPLAKQCPDFKDNPDENACCPSQINTGRFFCCTEERKAELEAELAAEARRRFISSHIPELVLCSLALLVLLFLLCSFLCRRTRFCPLLHRRKANGGSSRRPSSPSLQSGDSICGRPLAGHLRSAHHPRPAAPFLRSSYHQFTTRPAATEPPHFPRKEYVDAPPPYSLAIAHPRSPCASATLNCLDEEQQNRLNAQREEGGGGGEVGE